VIEIAEITLKDPGSNKILWSATAQEEFTACKILGTAARLPHDKHLRILSFGGDPQLLLPSSTAGGNAKSLRLEISLLVKSRDEHNQGISRDAKWDNSNLAT